MKLKIFCRCSSFPSWSGLGLISTPVVGRNGEISKKVYPFLTFTGMTVFVIAVNGALF